VIRYAKGTDQHLGSTIVSKSDEAPSDLRYVDEVVAASAPVTRHRAMVSWPSLSVSCMFPDNRAQPCPIRASGRQEGGQPNHLQDGQARHQRECKRVQLERSGASGSFDIFHSNQIEQHGDVLTVMMAIRASVFMRRLQRI
jgi:hypothetical protein